MDNELKQNVRKSDSFNSDVLKDIEGSIKRTDYNGHSLFHWAVQNKDIGLCRILISKGCDIETSNNFGVTPLMLASFCGYIDIVRLLLLLKADVESINTYGANSMASSCICNQHEILKLLKSYSKGTEIKDDTAWTQHPVLFAAASGSKDCVKYLYDQDSNCINLTNKISGMNSLMLADAGNFSDIKEDLLLRGAVENLNIHFFSQKISSSSIFSHSPLLLGSPCLSPHYCYNNSIDFSSIKPSAFLFPTQAGAYCTTPRCLNPPVTLIHLPVSSQPNLSDSDHPLTPNICVSPDKNSTIQKKDKPFYSWFQKLKRKRSRSLDNLTQVKRKRSSNIDNDDLLDYILSAAKLSEYKSYFVSQEVTFWSFLTLNEDDLIEIGIKKLKVRKKLLKIIKHYKRVFFSHSF